MLNTNDTDKTCYICLWVFCSFFFVPQRRPKGLLLFMRYDNCERVSFTIQITFREQVLARRDGPQRILSKTDETEEYRGGSGYEK